MESCKSWRERAMSGTDFAGPLDVYRERRSREDDLFFARTNIILVFNSLAAIAMFTQDAPRCLYYVAALFVLVLNLLWALYSPDPVTFISLLSKKLKEEPDERIRGYIVGAFTYPSPEWLFAGKGFRISPTWLMGRVVPPLLLLAWSAGGILATKPRSWLLWFVLAGILIGVLISGHRKARRAREAFDRREPARMKAFLFDCDGALFDTEKLKARSWGRGMVQLLRSKGPLCEEDLNHIEDEIAKMYRAGGTTKEVAEDVLRRCKSAFGAELGKTVNSVGTDEFIKARNEAKDKILDEAFPPIESNKEGSSNLVISPVWRLAVAAKRDGYPLALVTTTQKEWVRRYFRASDLRDHNENAVTEPDTFFDVMVCGKKKRIGVKEAVCRIHGKLRHDEEIEGSRIDELFSQIPAEDVRSFVIVEDSPEGTQEARSVGVLVTAVPNDFTQDAFPHLVLSQEKLGGMSLTQVVDALRQTQVPA
jgi:beta-phosphoglucomutase-like phosphatase (HAD superfamily)